MSLRYFALPFLLLGCNGSCAGSTPGVDEVLTAESEMPEVEPRELAFVFRARGADGAVPTSIAFHGNLPIFPSDSVGKAPPEGTSVVLAPPVPGVLSVQDRESLVFTPSEPFKPGTPYNVRLVSIGAKDPPEWLTNWTERKAEFTTPPFGFLRAALTDWRPAHRNFSGSAAILVSFTGPVSVEDVQQHVTFQDGEQTFTPAFTTGPSANTVTATVTGEVLSALIGHDVAVNITSGVLHGGDTTIAASAATATIRFVEPGPIVEVAAVKVREGMNGFYLDVFCDDDAVSEKRYFWDRDDYEDYRLSIRCSLTEESAARAVHVSVNGKDTPITVSPSDTGFRVFGAFAFGQLTLRIDAGAQTVDGGVLPVALDKALDIPHREAKINFASQGRYLPHSAWTSLAIQHTNVAAVELTVRHVPEENVVFWMSGSEPADTRTSNVILKKTIALAAPLDESATSWVDVGGLLPDASSGLYQISLAEVDPAPEKPKDPDADDDDGDPDTGGSWRRRQNSYHSTASATSRILLTDMHLVAKVSTSDATHGWAKAVDAWAIDVHTNAAVSGSTISLIRPSGQVVSRCVTDGQGHCAIAVPADGVETTSPMALLARNGKDFTYLKFADLKLQVPQDTAGATGPEAPYRAAAWTDRGVYRPGDTAHVAVLLRGEDHLAPSPSVPMALKLYDPSGKELKKQVVEPNEAGLAVWDVPFGDWATTGSYRVAAETGNKVVGSVSFNVEEFVPERLKVTASSNATDALATDPTLIEVQGDWLFGGAAVGSAVELTCQIEPGVFAPKSQPGFRFGPWVATGEPTPRPITLGVAEDSLDEAGHAQIACPTSPSAGGLGGPGVLVARAAVFEGDSGRTTVQEARVPVHPDRSYIGLKGPDKAEVGRPFKVEGVIVDWQGKPVSGTTKVDLTLLRLEEEVGWMWDYDSNESVYRRSPRRAKEASLSVVATNGAFSAELTPNDDGAGWVVMAQMGRTRTDLNIEGGSRRWWWSSWDSSVDQTPRPQLPKALVIGLPDSAKVGEAVTARIVAPYAGHVLWTVEAEGVLESRWEEVEAGETTWAFELEAFRPNVYVSALLVKDPHLESQSAFLPDRAFGVANLRLEPVDYTMPLALTVPLEVRPQSPLTIQVDAGPQTEPGFLTLAAVDAGILSLTKFKDPDPTLAIFARRALGVTSYETVGWTLLSQPGGAGRRTGGDDDSGGGRTQMVKPVALWSGAVPIPSNGKLTITLPIPSYRGSLHIMAVASTRSRMGHASADVAVRDPLTLVATMPRFLTVGDIAQVPVQVTNLTGSAQDVSVTMNVTQGGSAGQLAYADISGSGPSIAMGGAQSGKLKLAANASGTLIFQLAGRSTGAARVDLTATAGKEVSTDHFDIPVGLWEPEVTDTVRIPLGNGTTSLDAAFEGWKPGTERSQVWVTANPYAQAFAHLKHLIRYPYGCIEQTTSSARPLLYARDLVSKAAPDSLKDKTLEHMVQAGIDRVLSMQTPSGGFSYWPGGNDAVVWGTAYAVHFLLDAQQAGFPVPKADVDDAVRWLGRELDSTRVTDHDRAYGHYLLARAGQPRMAAAQALYDRLGTDARDEDRYLLQAAIWLAGDHRYESLLKHPNTTMSARRLNDWTFYSDIRERGLMLSIFRDLFGPDPAGQPLADAVAGALTRQTRSAYYNTQELAWGLTGLGKSIGKGVETVDAKLLINGKPHAGEAGNWLLSRVGSAPVTVQGKTGLFAVVTTTGNRVSGANLWGQNGVRVSRAWKDLEGNEVNPTDLVLGTPMFVDLTIENLTRYGVQNVALTDRVPAAWEIENPRLGRGSLPDWVNSDELWTTENMNVRDDRIEVFGTLPGNGTVHVIYKVRATFAGTFHVPEASVEAMYDPTYWARIPGGPTIVTGPWEGEVL